MKNPFQKTMLVTSVVYMLLGLLLILWPDQARRVICYLLGAAALLYGGYRIAAYFMQRQNASGDIRFGVALGIALAVLGLFLLFKADAVATVLAAVVGVAVIIDSILRLQIALNLRPLGGGWLPLFITALVTLALGVLLLFNPFQVMRVASVVAGVCLLIDGAFTLWGVLRAKNIRQKRTVAVK
jgi:uncharacterized membrane protein HdeD (DUF308 family)